MSDDSPPTIPKKMRMLNGEAGPGCAISSPTSVSLSSDEAIALRSVVASELSPMDEYRVSVCSFFFFFFIIIYIRLGF